MSWLLPDYPSIVPEAAWALDGRQEFTEKVIQLFCRFNNCPMARGNQCNIYKIYTIGSFKGDKNSNIYVIIDKLKHSYE